MTAYHRKNEAKNPDRPHMQSDQTDGTEARQRDMAAAGASSEQVAEAVGSTLRDVEQVLASIVGARGAAALYKRSLHLANRAFPWLPDASTSAPMALDVRPLTAALAGQTAADAAMAGARVLREFHALLTTLIGASLTERLLRSVWAPFLSNPSTLDSTQ